MVQVCVVAASGLGFSFGIRGWTEIKIQYAEGLYMHDMLKLTSNKFITNQSLNG